MEQFDSGSNKTTSIATINTRKRRSSEKMAFLKYHEYQECQNSEIHSYSEVEIPTFSLSDCDLLGLPSDKLQLYKEKRKVSSLYEWQKECLSDPRLQKGSNMILSLPTGAGKTLIAELLMLRETIVKQKDCILILPYVAIVQEKIQSLTVLEELFGIHVEEYAALKGRIPPIKRKNKSSMYICTIEKANMVINSLIENDRLERIGLVVVDELHMLGEGSRGATLEQCLTKILYRNQNNQSQQKTQIVGMSATLNNIDEIASFLDAYLYRTDFRPVQLIERVKIQNTLYRVDPGGKLIFDRNLGFNKLEKKDHDGLVPLLSSIVPTKSVLIFCPTKQNCENVCTMIANLIPKHIREYRAAERSTIVEQMKEENDSRICKTLAHGILNGIAYHHSGLTNDERQHIEYAFQTGIICVICCTSTLAAGVNLPARRVIIKGPYVGREFLAKSQYLQMVGRAGRAGYDEKGDSVTIVKPGHDEAKFRQMLSNPLGPCISNLSNNSDLARFILDLIALRMARTRYEMRDILQMTFLGKQKPSEIDAILDGVMQELEYKEILKLEEDCYVSTSLGNATFNANLPPDSARTINMELIKNLHEGIVLASHFHLLFTIIPYDVYIQIDWNIFHSEYMRLAKGEIELLGKMGLGEGKIIGLIKSGKHLSTGEPAMRLYIAFMMQRIWNQEPFWEVAERFAVPRGWLQSVLQSTCSQASSIARFSDKLPSLWPLTKLLPEMVQRLNECKRPELIPLLAIDCVKRGRAQQLYENNFKTVGSIAKAIPEELVKAIGNLNMLQAQKIINSAKSILRDQIAEKAEELEAMGADSNDLIISM